MTEMASGLSVSDYVFVVGEVYYYVTYPDMEMRFPLIESYVFLGKNVSDEDVEDTWYFQPASDYAVHGSALTGSECPVLCASRGELIEFRALSGLMKILSALEARRLAKK